MWHETKDEMLEILKSIFRVDMDQCNRKLARKYFDVKDDDYYEWETHILFDDAFHYGGNAKEKAINIANEAGTINNYVRTLISVMDEAASYVHCKNIKVKPCKKYPAKYGGRLVWTLPGGTRIVCHLKGIIHEFAIS